MFRDYSKPVRYLPSLKRATVSQCRVQPAMALAHDLYASPSPRGYCEFICAAPKPDSKNDCERTVTECKPFFDFEQVVDDEALEPQIAVRVLKEVRRVINIGLEMSGFQPGTIEYQIFFASRSRVVPGGYKVSYHVTVNGLRTTPFALKNLIQRAGSSPFEVKWDLSIYSKTRRLCMIQCYKSHDDTAVMRPVNSDDFLSQGVYNIDISHPDHLIPYFVQAVDDSWPILEFSRDAAPRILPGKRVRAAGGDDGDDGSDESPIRRSRVPRVSRALPDDEASDDEERDRASSDLYVFESFKALLEKVGFHNIGLEGGFVSDDSGFRMVHFDSDARGSKCPLCGHVHENLRYKFAYGTKGVYVRNLSQRCECLGLLDVNLVHPLVRVTLSANDVVPNHSTFASFLSNEMRDRFFYCNDKPYMFKGSYWKRVGDTEIKGMSFFYLRDAVIRPEHALWRGVLESLTSRECGFDTSFLEKIVSAYVKIMQMMEHESFFAAITRMLPYLACVSPEVLNSGENVLHFTNGRLDLDTLLFRETEATDFNTMTTGYDYDSHVTDGVWRAYLDMMQKIYPNPAVLEAVQRAFGSSLTGECDAKKFFVFTDPGSGYNGKSVVLGLHNAALGDYASPASQDFLYHSSNRNAEAPSPFMATLDGKRSVFVEELDPKHQLSEGNIKRWTGGGNPLLPARELHSKPYVMKWRAKIFVAVNRGKMARFDPYDDALYKRLLVIPHESYFTTDERALNPLRHIYRLNPQMPKIAIDNFKMAHMKFCLEGYARFRAVGLGDETMPGCILDFKKMFVYRDSPVYQYLNEWLEPSSRSEDVVQLDRMWEMYRRDKRSLRWLTKDQFTISFRVFAETVRPGSYEETTHWWTTVATIRGMRVKNRDEGAYFGTE